MQGQLVPLDQYYLLGLASQLIPLNLLDRLDLYFLYYLERQLVPLAPWGQYHPSIHPDLLGRLDLLGLLVPYYQYYQKNLVDQLDQWVPLDLCR